MSEPVPSITSAPEPLAVDQARRTRSYLIQMSIRVVCIIGAVVFDGWVRWVLVAAAVVLPYTAVLIANAGRDHVTQETSPVPPQAAPALTERSEPTDADAAGPAPTPGASPGAGRVIDHEDD